jgi:poly(beta-D-mannuronate) lyase
MHLSFGAKGLILACICGTLLTSADNVTAAVKSSKAKFSCEPAARPVVSLDLGSRYAPTSQTKSEISDEANAQANAALEPVDDFVDTISQLANAADLKSNTSQAMADCVMASLDAWATGDALTRLETLNARLAVSPRLSGIALAYSQVKLIAKPDPDRDKRIETWLQGRGRAVMAFFDKDAGPMASTNNLRAWAALATAAIADGIDDQPMRDWARKSYRLIICGANENGTLPQEMKRGERALHYQLHALAPLVVTLLLIDPANAEGDELCDDRLKSIVEFTLAAMKDPTLVEADAGAEQTFSKKDQKLAAYQMAWAEPYLERFPFPELNDFVQPLRPLVYSKIGGDMTQIYRAGHTS